MRLASEILQEGELEGVDADDEREDEKWAQRGC